MSILEDLWYGNLRPGDEPHPKDSAARLLQTQVSELEDALCKTFTEEQIKRFLDYEKALWDLCSASETLAFVRGFRLGTKFLLEAGILP